MEYFDPSLAAVLHTAVSEERTELKDLLGRLFVWRCGVYWYLAMLLDPLTVVLGATVVDGLLGGPGLGGSWLPEGLPSGLILLGLLPAFLISFVFGGLWGGDRLTSYDLSELQEKRSAYYTLILDAIWDSSTYLCLYRRGDSVLSCLRTFRAVGLPGSRHSSPNCTATPSVDS